MQEINVTLNIRDCIICNNCKQIYEKEVLINSFSTTITLLNGYILNLISQSDTRCTVIIQNGQNVIIRNIYNYETQIYISSDCCCSHILNISCS